MRAEVSLKELAAEEEDVVQIREVGSKSYTSRTITIKTSELRMEQVKLGGSIFPNQ